jgi:hypothetical protein
MRRYGRWLAALAALGLVASPAGAEAAQDGFFGPAKDFELQPEVDVYVHVAPETRLLFESQGSWIPGEGYTAIALGAHVDWYVVPFFRRLLAPDEAKTRALDLRLGLRYSGTLDPGTASPSQVLAIQFDFTPRYFLPGDILASNRNRGQVRWTFDTDEHVSFLYRGRIQLERELELGHVGLTPFVNAELFWQAPPSMWEQFRMQAGLQCSFGGIGRGQVIEVNYSTVTYLQPTRSWRPMVGVIWYLYI